MKKAKPIAEKMSDDSVKKYYDKVSASYFEQYKKENLALGKKYPQNYFRLQMLLQRMAQSGVRSVFEVGTGDGTPLAFMGRMGFSVAGCDISEKMVGLTKDKFKKMHLDPRRVKVADIQDSLSVVDLLAHGPYDALIALGVMPHVSNDEVVLKNMQMFLKKGSKVFIEFRNKFFSLFTFNRNTKSFILDDLLKDVAGDVRNEVAKELDRRLELSQPVIRDYDQIPARFHNPFEVIELFKKVGFANPHIHWYHYHAAMPLLESKIKQRFWEESAKMEFSSSWRSYFLCSAFVIEADVPQ